jgi:hypothetical protein
MIDLQTLLILQEITIFVTFGQFLWAWIRTDHVKADCKTEAEILEANHKYSFENMDNRVGGLENSYFDLVGNGIKILQERILALETAYSDMQKTIVGRICDLERDVEKLEKRKL